MCSQTRDTRLRSDLPSMRTSCSQFAFVPAMAAKTRLALHNKTRRSAEFSFRRIRGKDRSGKFMAVWEDQFLHLQSFLAILCKCTDDRDLVARLEGTSAPASPRQKIRARKFTLPFDGLAAVVFRRKHKQCMRIDEL